MTGVQWTRPSPTLVKWERDRARHRWTVWAQARQPLKMPETLGKICRGLKSRGPVGTVRDEPFHYGISSPSFISTQSLGTLGDIWIAEVPVDKKVSPHVGDLTCLSLGSAQVPCLSPYFPFLLVETSPLPRNQKCPGASWEWGAEQTKQAFASSSPEPLVPSGPCHPSSLIMGLAIDFPLIPKEGTKGGLHELWGGWKHSSIHVCVHSGHLRPSSSCEAPLLSHSRQGWGRERPRRCTQSSQMWLLYWATRPGTLSSLEGPQFYRTETTVPLDNLNFPTRRRKPNGLVPLSLFLPSKCIIDLMPISTA